MLKNCLEEFTDVVITGGSSGIGMAFIESLFALNKKVVIYNLSRSKPVLVNSDITMIHHSCDLSNDGDRKKQFLLLKEDLLMKKGRGKLLLINNSGFGTYGPFPEPDLDSQLNMIDLNIKGLVDLTGFLLPLLKERKGAIINIASTASFQPTPYLSTYGATKAFVQHWGLSLSQELKHDGIHVLTSCPGPTRTNFFARAGFKKSPVSDWQGLSAAEVVDDVLHALAKKKILITSGWNNKFLVALSSICPKSIVTPLAGIILKKVRSKG